VFVGGVRLGVWGVGKCSWQVFVWGFGVLLLSWVCVRVCVCVGVGGVVLCRCVCVCVICWSFYRKPRLGEESYRQERGLKVLCSY